MSTREWVAWVEIEHPNDEKGKGFVFNCHWMWMWVWRCDVFSALQLCVGYVLQYRLSIRFFCWCCCCVPFPFTFKHIPFHSLSLICNVLKASANPRRIEKIPMILSVRACVYFIHTLPCYVPYICSFSRHLSFFIRFVYSLLCSFFTFCFALNSKAMHWMVKYHIVIDIWRG